MRKIVVFFLISMLSSYSFASTFINEIELDTKVKGVILIDVQEELNPASCVNNDEWDFALSISPHDEYARQVYLPVILLALQSGSPVHIEGTGTCTAFDGVESLQKISVQNVNVQNINIKTN